MVKRKEKQSGHKSNQGDDEGDQVLFGRPGVSLNNPGVIEDLVEGDADLSVNSQH